MDNIISIKLNHSYLVFIGDVSSSLYAKTALGIMQWRPELAAGQLRFKGNTLDLGVPDMTVRQAAEAGVRGLIIGVASAGGAISDSWVSILEEAAAAGLDVISGMHERLEFLPGVKNAAEKSGAALINLRVPASDIPIGTGRKRSGRRVLMVGTDCAVGKKYTALALAKAMKERSFAATFRATGQTGILIAGAGVPIDAVVVDFISGAAEMVSPDADRDHWDIIEGQGSLFNASYAGVSLGLLHGSQPDAIVVCHDPGREFISTCPHIKMPTIAECMDLNLICGRLTNPKIRCIGISINTSGLPEDERQSYLQSLHEELGLPCVDPVLDGCDAIVDVIEARFLVDASAVTDFSQPGTLAKG